MKGRLGIRFSVFALLSVLAIVGKGQDIRITTGPEAIGENQAWTITISVSNDRLKSYSGFPEINGFRKGGTSQQSSTSIINGQISSSESVTMTYRPSKQGTITVPSFTMKVNDKDFTVPGKKVKIGPPVQQQDPYSRFFDRDPVDDFFGRGEPEYVDLKDDAFLAVTTSKDEVWAGEGFTAALSFYISVDNRAPLQWYNLSDQLNQILKKLKPANCWEENFNIETIEGEPVTINGKDYTEFKIYQATFFPLNAEEIVFPSVELEMIKYKVAKNPSFYGQNRKEDFKKFASRPKRIKVKPLPPHPLKDVVAVGDYKLSENLSSGDMETGKSTAYSFVIEGQGNISGIEKLRIPENQVFEVYEPQIRQNIRKEINQVTGTKSFNYFIIPKEPGEFQLGDYFQWYFFNPRTGKYDTLRSQLTAYVTGESKKNEAIQANDLGTFYDKIETSGNTLAQIPDNRWIRWVFNAFILVVLGTSAYLVMKK